MSFNKDDKTNKDVGVAILENISKKDPSFKEECERLIPTVRREVADMFNYANKYQSKLGEIFVKHFTEYYCWQGAFKSLMKEDKYANDPAYKNINIDDLLIPVIYKVANLN